MHDHHWIYRTEKLARSEEPVKRITTTTTAAAKAGMTTTPPKGKKEETARKGIH